MPETFEDAFYDSTVRRSVYLERYKAGVVRRMDALLRRVSEDTKSKLLDASTEWGIRRQNALIQEIADIRAGAFTRLQAELTGELAELSSAEVGFVAGSLNGALPEQMALAVQFVAPAAEQVHAAAMARPFQGRLLREWVADLAADDMKRIRNSVRIGYVEGEGVDAIVRRIVGTRARKFSDGVEGVTRRQAEALVRTAVQHTASFARQRVYEANSPLVESVRWVATLDGNTCFIPSTPVLTPHGEVPIDSVHPGEKVIGPSGIARTVEATKTHNSRSLVKVTLSNGETAVCTADHMFLLYNGEWAEAQLLLPNDKLRAL